MRGGGFAHAFDARSFPLVAGEEIQIIHEVGHAVRGSSWIEGTLVITDARLFYRARAKNFLNQSITSREIHLKDVTGVAVALRRGMSLGSFVGIVIGGILALFFAYSTGKAFEFSSTTFGAQEPVKWSFFFTMPTLMVLVAWAWLLSRSQSLVVAVLSRDNDASPVSFFGSSGAGGEEGFLTAIVRRILGPLLHLFGLFDASDAASVADLERAQRFADELGAQILELQRRQAPSDARLPAAQAADES